jgi:tRNA pseudouridine55 synthase
VDISGILLVDKDVGRTSFETVKLVKRKLHAHKAGHAGTLDKSASGLLILCINRATSVQQLVMGQFKKYRATIRFGIQTDTLDRYGHVVETGPLCFFSEKEIRDVLTKLTGRITQIPPVYSALHQNGKRLYRRALNGERVEVNPREVEIRDITLIHQMQGGIVVEVDASKGTYIRSLARDIASQLGTCGYVGELRRISIGSFSVDDAFRVDEIDQNAQLIPLHRALDHIPQLHIERECIPMIYNGVPVCQVLKKSINSPLEGSYLRLVHREHLLAIVKLGKTPTYFKVFRPEDPT